MPLRFQRQDEVDRQLKEGRMSLRSIVLIFAFFAAAFALIAWLRGDSRKTYDDYLLVLTALFFVVQVVLPFIFELRARLKEIDGKASSIESTVNESKEHYAELLGRLTAIENRLDGIQGADRA